MRFGRRRLFGGFTLSLALGLGIIGCSGQQQQEEGLEVSDQENLEASNEASDQEYSNQEYNNQEYSNQEYNNQEYSNEQYDNEDTINATAEINGTENDLQEIIQEMNGQQTADLMSEGNATALNQEFGMQQAAPMDGMAMDTSAPMDATAMDTSVPMNSSMPMNATAAVPAPAMGATAAPSSSPIPFQPGGSPAGQGLPEVGSKMAYIVQKGDTLGRISSKIYGSPARWNELASLSGLTNPSRIFPGDIVYYTLDESALAFASAYESVPRAEEIVQQGDTLATIARRIYGSSSEWRSVWRQNDTIDNPDRVAPGTTVYYIPTGALTAAVKKAKENLDNMAQLKNPTTHKFTAKASKAQDKTGTIDITKINEKGLEIGQKFEPANNNLVSTVSTARIISMI